MPAPAPTAPRPLQRLVRQPRSPHPQGASRAGANQIVTPMAAGALTYATREGVARRFSKPDATAWLRRPTSKTRPDVLGAGTALGTQEAGRLEDRVATGASLSFTTASMATRPRTGVPRCGAAPCGLRRAARSGAAQPVSTMPASAPRPRPGDTQFVVKPRKVCRTLELSCEAP
jgi:hypothetical protein